MRPGLALGAHALLVVALGGCAAGKTVRVPVQPTPVAMPLVITRVGVEPKTIDVSQRETATVRYALSHPAAVRLDLVD